MDLMLFVIKSIFGSLLGSEANIQTKRFSETIMKRAITNLLPHQRPLYERTWMAHFEDCDGPISKLQHAIGCWWNAGTWRLDLSVAEYLGYRIYSISGLTMKTYSFYIRLRVTAGFYALSCMKFDEARLEAARQRGNSYADAVYQCGALYQMGAAIAIDPVNYPPDKLVSRWLKLFGLFVGYSMLRYCMEFSADNAFIRNSFGKKVVSGKLHADLTRHADEGLQLLNVTKRLMEIAKQVQAKTDLRKTYVE